MMAAAESFAENNVIEKDKKVCIFQNYKILALYMYVYLFGRYCLLDAYHPYKSLTH